MRPSQSFHVLETLRAMPSVPLYRKGIELSFDDSQTVLDVYQQWLLLMMDLGYLSSETLERTGRRLWIDIIRVDVLELNNTFAKCLHLVRVKSSEGFKGFCKEISPHLYSLIKDDIGRMILSDAFAAKRLIQLFSYTSRLSLKDIDLTQQLLEEYLENESQIREEFPESLTNSLNLILKNWLGRFEPTVIVPRHGPGGIAEHGRCSLETKYKTLGSDSLLRYAFEVDTLTDSYPFARQSKTIFVPKSYKTFRTISMEPATLQYHQQGVWRAIEQQVSSDYYLRSHIGFRDQSRNAQLAKEGSIERNFATLDLSSASDLVSYSLVKKLFRGTWLLRYLVASRSTKTSLPDGRIIELKKFAPMGSSLCFPVETLIFASLCEFVTRSHRVAGRYSVYGDDIVVPTQCANTVSMLLETLGFRLNASKSFIDSNCWFRESCGGEYCDGVDVTPMKVSRTYASTDPLVRVTKLIDKANEAYLHGYRNLRYFFLNKLFQTGFNPLFAPSELLSDNYTNYQSQLRWNPYLHRLEVKVNNLKTKVDEKDLRLQNEAIRYRHWLETTSQRLHIGDGFQSLVCRTSVCISETWRAKPYEEPDQLLIDCVLAEKSPSHKFRRLERSI